MFGFGSKSIVGLDVGSSSIKAVELKRGRGGLEVAHLGLEPLSPDIVVDSMIVDSGTVSSAISKLFADSEIKTKSGGHRGKRPLGHREEDLAAFDERPGTGRNHPEGSGAAHSL